MQEVVTQGLEAGGAVDVPWPRVKRDLVAGERAAERTVGEHAADDASYEEPADRADAGGCDDGDDYLGDARVGGQHRGLGGDERHRDQRGDQHAPGALTAARGRAERAFDVGELSLGRQPLAVFDERAAVGEPFEHRVEPLGQSACEPQPGEDRQPRGVKQHLRVIDTGAADHVRHDDRRKHARRDHHPQRRRRTAQRLHGPSVVLAPDVASAPPLPHPRRAPVMIVVSVMSGRPVRSGPPAVQGAATTSHPGLKLPMGPLSRGASCRSQSRASRDSHRGASRRHSDACAELSDLARSSATTYADGYAHGGELVEFAHRLVREAEDVRLLAVAAERARGVPWDTIGEALGDISRQAAQKRFGERVDELELDVLLPVRQSAIGDGTTHSVGPEAALNPERTVKRLDAWAQRHHERSDGGKDIVDRLVSHGLRKRSRALDHMSAVTKLAALLMDATGSFASRELPPGVTERYARRRLLEAKLALYDAMRSDSTRVDADALEEASRAFDELVEICTDEARERLTIGWSSDEEAVIALHDRPIAVLTKSSDPVDLEVRGWWLWGVDEDRQGFQ